MTVALPETDRQRLAALEEELAHLKGELVTTWVALGDGTRIAAVEQQIRRVWEEIDALVLAWGGGMKPSILMSGTQAASKLECEIVARSRAMSP